MGHGLMSFLDLIGPGRFIDPAVIQASGRSLTTRYPYAAWMPIPENATQPRIVPTQFIMHSMAGPKLTTIDALWHYIARADITGESTFIDDMDGRMAQVVEANVRADNNYKANPRAVSIETQDLGYLADPGIRTTPWTDPQMAQHAGLAAWLNLRFNIPLSRCTAWDAPGMDGHRAFPEWSTSVGKTCPGDTRWAQIPEVLIAARWIVAWAPVPQPPSPPVTNTTGARMGAPLVLRYGGTPTSNWSGYYSFDGVTRQGVRGMHHAAQLVALGAIDARTLNPVTSRTWTDVTHTVSTVELEEWLTPGAD